MSDVGVLDKVMAIMTLFPTGTTRLEPPEVAERLAITTPTAYRLMKAMAEHGLLEHDERGYRLGVALLHLGSRVADGLDVKHVARAHLEWLRDQTAENAELHLRHGAKRVPIDVAPSHLNLRPMGQVGVPFPLHVGASSKVLLAWLERSEVELLVHTSHEAQDDDEPFDEQALFAELAKTRHQGWAASDGEREVGVASVAAPVRDRHGAVVAAVVVSGPTARLMRPAAFRTAREGVLEAAARTSQQLGHLDDPATREAR